MRIKKIRKPKLGIIGKIKVGEKRISSKTGKEYPVSLDYFKASANMQAIQDVFDSNYERKSTLPICFGTNDDDFNTDHRFEVRNSQGKLYSYGDGENFMISRTEGFVEYPHATILDKYGSVEVFMEKTQNYLKTQKHSADWKEVLTLRFIIPKIPVLGVWELRTMASRSSIDQILNNYDSIKSINDGSVYMVPFLLHVQKVKSARALEQSRMYPVISLNPLVPELAKGNLIDTDLIESASIKMLE